MPVRGALSHRAGEEEADRSVLFSLSRGEREAASSVHSVKEGEGEGDD